MTSLNGYHTVMDSLVRSNSFILSGIRGVTTQAFFALTANISSRGGVLVQFSTVFADTASCGRRAAQSAVALSGDGALQATRANIDGALVGRVPVTSHWGLLGQGQVGLGLVDLLGLVGVLVDDGL